MITQKNVEIREEISRIASRYGDIFDIYIEYEDSSSISLVLVFSPDCFNVNIDLNNFDNQLFVALDDEGYGNYHVSVRAEDHYNVKSSWNHLYRNSNLL